MFIFQVHSVFQVHTLQDSENDYLFNIIEENKVECLSFDPHTIKLNDGSENFIRIQTSESTEGNTESPMSRPISNNYVSDTADTDDTLVFNHYQTDFSYDKNSIEKKKRKRHYDEEMENQRSNNEKSSDDKDKTDEDL